MKKNTLMKSLIVILVILAAGAAGFFFLWPRLHPAGRLGRAWAEGNGQSAAAPAQSGEGDGSGRVPSGSPPSPEARQHYETGLALKRAGKYPEAVAELQKAIGLKRDYVEAHWVLAWTYVAQGRKDEAMGEFQVVVWLAGESEQGREARAAVERLGGKVSVSPRWQGWGGIAYIAPSPNGRLLAIKGPPAREGGAYLHILSLQGGPPKKLAGSVSMFDWSPDSTHLCCFAKINGQFGMYVSSVESGEVKRIRESKLPVAFRGVWSPDGQQIAFVGLHELILSTVDGKEQRHYRPDGNIPMISVYWGPTAQHLYFVEYSGWAADGPQGTVFVRMDTTSLAKTILIRGTISGTLARPTRDYQRWFFNSGGQISFWDQTSQKKQPIRTNPELQLAPDASFDCSPSGEGLIVRDTGDRLWFVRVADGQVHHLTDHARSPRWVSEDLIVYATPRKPEKQADAGGIVWRIRPDGSGRQKLAEFVSDF